MTTVTSKEQFCCLHEMNPSDPPPRRSSSLSSSSSLSPSPVTPPPLAVAAQRQLSHADKLRKVISELVETERTYVKDLSYLIERYLTPLQRESFLCQDELDVLFGNLAEMLDFQVKFLRTLEDGTKLVADLDQLETVQQFKKVLFSLGGSFLYYADRFKLYSAFCASHTKVPKVLAKAKTDPDFKAFLDERNPRQQHSSTLESYLIKPIQRVLKYPLLLRELYSLTDPDSEEHYHLDVAMKAMNKVASHINEMQKIHEEFGAVFDQLISEQTSDKKEVADLSMGDLLFHSTMLWINRPASLVKGKRDPELAAFVFKTAVVFVYRESSKQQKKKTGVSHRVTMSDDRDLFRFRHMIPIDALQVRALANVDDTALCEITHVKSQSEGRPERNFQLCCSSVDSKKDFLKAAHSTLRDKQRRQLMKTESLPPNQQYVPFGGKRLCNLKGNRPVINRAVSAPSRNLGRRRLVRNRFTIETDLILHGNSEYADSSPTHSCPDSSHLAMPSHNPQLPTQKPQQPAVLKGGDTDRWVEEQFDLCCYDDEQGVVAEVKETDILSDDDEYCQSVKALSAKPCLLEQRIMGVTLDERSSLTVDEEEIKWRPNRVQEETRSRVHGVLCEAESPPSRSPAPPVKLTPLRKQCAVEGGAESDCCDVIWVRREDYGNVKNTTSSEGDE
ncbi:hypothetical protein DPEC_G00230620 [Dallia pectoralis]|uniref:Uncharacterized protein n=1 Tax=Dallia pectoralis TaxID=75939 RepID=A0ACC2G263_DALPE|nr:hypothetical protein DPEC_G00230620 [Dallia pectoralis]